MTLSWVLAAMLLLAPGRDHSALGAAIAKKVDASDPLFRGDASKVKTAALLVAVSYRESGFDARAVGDKGHSFCAFQIHDSSGGSKVLLDDVDACVERGFSMLKTSLHLCPEHPVAWYARGPRGCGLVEGQRISRDRMAIAQRLVREVTP